MALLISGLALFFIVHLVPTLPSVRAGLVERLGAGIYRGLFSLVSIAGLVAIVLGYGQMQGLARSNPELWTPPVWIKHVVLLLMISAFAHLLANGDLASLLLFGSFLAFAVIDRISVMSRPSPGPLGDARGG